ncbi:tetratricopeptide repeat protein [Paracoccus aestuariivivens]|uniref:Tetratricopeptide repeat protein n=1 Tax=Paracoccus aestuariivivens TaxID=1820333 RepID=A0A6L6J8E4_9RHOB|nr:tetratricopeptide repeat protein [Paracoccus aestuariivivens]MTH77438.1 tetratricopeptide repeat protein [Paracoccus aestuariivivens]
MRWLGPHYQIAVTTAFSLWLALPGQVFAQQDLPLPGQDEPPAQSAPDGEIMPDDEAPDGESSEGESADPGFAPAEPSEPTAEARLQEREDLDLLFRELGQTGGETWARAETDILRIWSRSGSASMDMLYKRGEAALDAGNVEEAIGHLTALTDHAPQFASGWYLRGVAFYLQGQTGPAIADMAQVLALEPRHFGALTQLGTMFEELGDDARALTAYRASLKIHPHQEDAADAVKRLEEKTKGTDA